MSGQFASNWNTMRIHTIVFLLAGLLALPLAQSQAQFRPDAGSTLDRTGPILRTSDQDRTSFLGLQDFRMDHSYEVTVGSFGGNMFNQNTYTNTMHMMFNDRLYGRVDLSMAHSPFGPGFMGQNEQAQFFVRNAELNYKLNENTRFQVRFQQIPQGHGYGYGYYPPHYRRNHLHDPFRAW